jgi:hypothetical protein
MGMHMHPGRELAQLVRCPVQVQMQFVVLFHEIEPP